MLRANAIDYTTTVYHLICRDLRVFREEFWGKLIDTSLLLFTTICIFGYFLPSYGLQGNYGSFLLVGVIAGFGFFEVMTKVGIMIADLEGDRTILYTLTLPIPSWAVFVYLAVSWAILSSTLSLLMFPLGKLLLFKEFTLVNVNLLQLPLIFIMSNLFFGFFALWLSAILKNMGSMAHLFVRIINPMYSFGGWWYSYAAISKISAELGYLHLINPLLYVMEGMRAATLGQEGYLPFWTSLAALTGFTLFFAWDAIRRLQRRLDCV
jgi:ABC-2 type transport system permease protein